MEEEYCLILGRVPHTWSNVDESASYCDIDKVLRIPKRLGGGSLHDLSEEDLNKVFIGMKGIIKLGYDKRDKDRCNDLIELKRGIYATFEVVCLNFEEEETQMIYRVQDNFFRENKLISDDEGIRILGKNKFDLRQRSAGLITLEQYNEIMKCYKKKS